MQDLNDKLTGDNLTAAEWNEVPSELQNIIENTGQVLSGGDLNQLGKGVAQYAANGNFYTDSGAGNSYVLTQVGLKQSVPAYADGMAIEFVPANTNTGAATVNVAGLGVKNISNTSSGGEIISGTRITMRYNIGSGEFEIFQTAAVPVTAGTFFGLTMSNDIDTDHDISIAIGECADSTNAFLLSLSSILVKQIDAAWVAGNNNGGLFSGTVAINTWYHVFLIRKDSDGTIDAGFDTSVTAVNIPAGYTAYRRIGSVLTDGAANIIQFTQIGSHFRWKLPANDFGGSAPTSETSVTLTVPTGLNVIAKFNAVAIDTTTGGRYYRVYSPFDNNAVPSATNCTRVGYHNTTSGEGGDSEHDMLTNTSAQVKHRSTNSAQIYLNTVGWEDLRGAI